MKRAVILGGTGRLGRAMRRMPVTASLDLGYEPVGTYAATIPHQIDWLLDTAASGADPVAHDPFFGHFLDYRLEDTIANP